METVCTIIGNDLHMAKELQEIIKEKAATYAAEEILKIETLIIKGGEPKAIQYMIDQILKVVFEVAEVGVDMNLLATVKRAERKERSKE